MDAVAQKGNEKSDHANDKGGADKLEKVFTTFRIHKELKLSSLKKKAAEFWGLTEEHTDLLDETLKPITGPAIKKTFSNDLEQKAPFYYLVHKSTKVDKTIQNKEDSRLVGLSRLSSCLD